jgi:hypothetical protein
MAFLAAAGSAAAQEAPPQAEQQGTWVGPAVTGNDAMAAQMPAEPMRASEPASDVGTRDNRMLDHYMPPVNRAFEIAVGVGGGLPLGPGIGEFANFNEIKMKDIATLGGQVELALGYRASKHWLLGAYGSGALYSKHNVGTDTDSTTTGVTGGLQAEYHFRPTYVIDPVVSLGSGFAGLWVNPSDAQVTSLLGWQMAKVNIALDFRLTRTIAVAPVLGGDATLFLTKSGPTTNGFDNFTKVNYFLFGGLQGRFDIVKSPPSPPSYAKGEQGNETF